MKFTVDRAALVRMLEVIARKAPSKKWRDKEVRLSACAPRVFVEANESAGGIEALVLEDGTCLLEHKVFLDLLKSHFPKKNIIIAADERKITFATTTIRTSGFSRIVTAPGKFRDFPVTDDWLSKGLAKTRQSRTLPANKLPHAEKAIVERDKIVDYLLNSEHRIGSGKAQFFTKFGFKVENWEQLAQSLLIHGQTQEVKQVHATDFGLRYEIEGQLQTPDGRNPIIRSVWQCDKDAVAPRLITAYPLSAR
jgi:hypothetical protein